MFYAMNIKRSLVLGIGLLLSTFLGMALAQADKGTTVTLNIAEFVDLALSQSFTALQYHQQYASQQLALEAIEARHVPQLSFNTQVGKERKNTYGTVYQDHYQEGINAGVSMAWTLPTGATLSTSYQHEYGRALGLESIGVNKDYQSTEVTSAELLQPLLQSHPIDQEYLPVEAARLQWRSYQARGELLRLEGLRDALLSFVDYQVLVDKVGLHQQAVAYSLYRLQVAKDLLEAGRITQRDVTSAQVDWHQRQAQLVRAQGDQRLLLGRLGAALQINYGVLLQPLLNLPQLTQCLTQGQSQGLDVVQHLQLVGTSANVSRLHKQYQLTRYDLWPSMDLFYRYKGTHSSTVEDAIERSVGVQFSYSPTQWQTEANQALSRSTWLDARYSLDAQRKTLVNEDRLRRQQQAQLEQQLELASQLVGLAQQAYQQELLRFEEGVSSSVAVRDAQNQLQQAQEALLDDQSNWLQNRLHWNYVQSRKVDFAGCL